MPYGSYLTRSRHRTTWYARIVIPHDLRDAYNQRREIRKTLDTPCKVTARRRAMQLWLAYQQVFDALRNGQADGCIVPGWKALASLTTPSGSSQATAITLGTHPASQILHVTPLVALGRNGEHLSVSRVGMNPVTGELLVHKPTGAALEGAEGLRKAWGQGKPQGSQQVVYGSSQQVQAQVQPSDTCRASQRISVLFTQFVEERLAGARRKTVETMQQHLQVFIELKGDLPVSKLRKPVVRAFIQELKDYPSHRNHGRWKRMSLAEIRAAGKQPISETTQHNMIGNLHTFAEWLVEIEELDGNPFKFRLKKKAKAPEPDRTWTEAELKQWFCSDLVLQHRGSSRHAWKYWLPLLAIHTGARLEELAALSPGDFFEHEGIQAFKIHGEDGRFVKNASSWRMVPVHSRLISLGLLDYVEERQGSERLFTIKPYLGQYGKRASKAFGYLRERLGISPDFHGYRHTVIEALKLRGTSLTHIEWLVGHTGASMSDHYGSATDKRKWLSVLKEVVELLDWSDVLPER